MNQKTNNPLDGYFLIDARREALKAALAYFIEGESMEVVLRSAADFESFLTREPALLIDVRREALKAALATSGGSEPTPGSGKTIDILRRAEAFEGFLTGERVRWLDADGHLIAPGGNAEVVVAGADAGGR